MKPRVTIIEADHRPTRSSWRDDVAYVGPMGVFLLFTWAGGQWPGFYPASYVLKTLIVAAMLIAFRRYYTRIRWNHALLGMVVGAAVVVQWVGMELLILKVWPNYPRLSHADPFRPLDYFTTPWQAWGFIAIRWAGASLLVPVMEELFWRDWLWRTWTSPNDFKMAEVGEKDWAAFFAVAIAFGAGVHVEWMTAIVCGLIYGALLLYTRSLGACIIAHGVTNFLLGGYVLIWKDWRFW